MRNSRSKTISSHPKPTAHSLHSAFTLTEMLVAVAMGAMLIAGAASVFSLATQAVNSSQANTKISNKLRVLYSWLDRDFARIRLDGPLFLYPQVKDFGDGDTRLDQICFLISGHIPSMSTADSAGLSIILYGPNIATDRSLKQPYDWVLTRRPTLIVGDSGATGADSWQSSFAELIIDNPAGRIAWYEGWTKPNFDYDQNSGTYSFSDDDDVPTYLMGNVFEFKIVQYGIYDDAGVYSSVQVDMDTPTDKLQFTPTQNKPAWIEFEITLRAASNRQEDEQTSTYRVNLPRR